MDKNILNQFNTDFDKNTKLDKQKQEIFDKWEQGINPIKQTLKIHIDPSRFEKYYTRNAHPFGADLYVNKEIGSSLKPFTFNGKTSIIQEYDGRVFVIAKIEDLELPFYSSSAGTAGKEKGSWYPFYGFSEAGWVMKDKFNEKGDWVYNTIADNELQEKIKKMAEELTKNISLPLSPTPFVDNLPDYFDYQEIDDHANKKVLNTALGVPEYIDTHNINRDSGLDELIQIKKSFIKNK